MPRPSVDTSACSGVQLLVAADTGEQQRPAQDSKVSVLRRGSPPESWLRTYNPRASAPPRSFYYGATPRSFYVGATTQHGSSKRGGKTPTPDPQGQGSETRPERGALTRHGAPS
eukprot:scaffold10947_cov123-Isochrysis_galbana.AAC.2